jgi:hypothetical protein
MKFLIAVSAFFQLISSEPIQATGASKSPGFLSGNIVQLPINAPVNACGNSVNVIGAVNPAFGNNCENTTNDA